MTDRQKLEIAVARARRELRALAMDDAATAEQLAEATEKVDNLEARAAALPDDPPEPEPNKDGDEDAEARELRELAGRVEVRRYIGAAFEARSVEGAEGEYNQALGMDRTAFPLRLLAPEPRATTDTDSGVMQQTWLDRLFADSAAMRLGITMPSVAAGKASYPVTTAGASAAQRGRGEAASDASWTVGVTELQPTRNTVRAVFSVEDAARLRGLEDALRRDLRMALVEGIDRAIFVGDSGANENRADITGLTTATDVVERTITQAEKVNGPGVLEAFLAYVDGTHAAMAGDLRLVLTTGSYVLWEQSIHNDTADNQTLAGFLRAAGLSWSVRGGIEADTAAGDFAGFVGRARGIAGAGVAPVWEGGRLIRDPYSGAAKGEVALTLQTLWAFGLPRPTNFGRVKFVA